MGWVLRVIGSVFGFGATSAGEGTLFKASEVSEVLNAPPGMRLRVESHNGPVHVAGIPERQVRVTYEKSLRARSQVEAAKLFELIRVTIVNSDGDVKVKVDCDQELSQLRAHPSVSFRIQQSADVSSSIDISNGEITVSGLNARVDAATSNGAVRATGCKGGLILRTMNGSVGAHGCSGDVELRTSNGAIDADVETCRFKAETSNGRVGAILRIGSGPSEVTTRTSNGAIDLTLRGLTGADLDCRTMMGAVNVDIPLESQVRSRTAVTGSYGDRSCKIRAEVTNGAVHIK